MLRTWGFTVTVGREPSGNHAEAGLAYRRSWGGTGPLQRSRWKGLGQGTRNTGSEEGSESAKALEVELLHWWQDWMWEMECKWGSKNDWSFGLNWWLQLRFQLPKTSFGIGIFCSLELPRSRSRKICFLPRCLGAWSSLKQTKRKEETQTRWSTEVVHTLEHSIPQVTCLPSLLGSCTCNMLWVPGQPLNTSPEIASD
jgi:hypothetical protein